MPLMNGSTPMKPMRGCSHGLVDQMLAAAEADLEPEIVDGMRKQRGKLGRRRGEIEREPRQQRFDQRGLPGLERMPLAPPEEGARLSGLAVFHKEVILPGVMPAQAGIQSLAYYWIVRLRG